MQRYVIKKGYYQNDGVWVYSEVIYDTEINEYVYPNGLICDKIAESIPYGGVLYSPDPLSFNVLVKLNNVVIETINDEYELYQQEVKFFINDQD